MPRKAVIRIILASVLAIVLAHVIDSWAWQHLSQPDIYEHDLGRMLRVVGFLPVWLALGLALWLQSRDRRRALLLAGLPTAAALVGELLKILLRRERPGLHDGAYYFRPFAERPISTTNIGLPSSHAIVAFAGAWVLCRFYPRAAPVWIALATGCALTRVLAKAHFVSDVTVAAVGAYVVVGVTLKVSGKR